jgi:hypothetical protein
VLSLGAFRTSRSSGPGRDARPRGTYLKRASILPAKKRRCVESSPTTSVGPREQAYRASPMPSTSVDYGVNRPQSAKRGHCVRGFARRPPAKALQ